MVIKTYMFELIESKVPIIRGKNIITDSNVGGTKNTYKIYRVYETPIRKFKLIDKFFSRFVDKYKGTKSFLRPYQSVWNKKEHRLPAPYWGKGPLLNLWLVLSNDFNDIKNIRTLLPESNTKRHCTKIFNIDFKSQLLMKNLKLNKSFKQSKFEKLWQKTNVKVRL